MAPSKLSKLLTKRVQSVGRAAYNMLQSSLEVYDDSAERQQLVVRVDRLEANASELLVMFEDTANSYGGASVILPDIYAMWVKLTFRGGRYVDSKRTLTGRVATIMLETTNKMSGILLMNLIPAPSDEEITEMHFRSLEIY